MFLLRRRFRWPLSLGLTLFVAACSFSPSEVDLELHADGGGENDDAAMPDALAANDCDDLLLGQDPFDGDTNEELWLVRSDPGVTVEETGGELLVHLAANADAAGRGGYNSRDDGLTLVGKRIFAEVIPSQNTGVYARFTFRSFEQFFAFEQVSDVLRLRYRPPEGSTVVLYSTTYIADLQRYWQLREEDGLLHVETSPDGGDWSTVYSHELDSPEERAAMTFGSVELRSYTNQPIDDPGTTAFGGFNVSPACPFAQ